MMDSASKYRARVSVLILATCNGAKRGASSMTTRPRGNSTYRVFCGSSGRQSAAPEAATTSDMVGCWAARAGTDKKTSVKTIKNLKLRGMSRVLHKLGSSRLGGRMRWIFICGLVLLAWCGGLQSAVAGGQGYPGGQMPGGRGGMGPGSSIDPAGDASNNTPLVEKPDKAASKAYNAGMKSLGKAREYEAVAAKATDRDKKAAALEKVSDAYGKA